jgi:DNA-binding transcriptional LysR family regulator
MTRETITDRTQHFSKSTLFGSLKGNRSLRYQSQADCEARCAVLSRECPIYFYLYSQNLMAKTVDWERRIGRHLRLRDLHVFFAVVQSRSMAKAAAQLRITQPSVSKSIGDLEAALGVQLFDRSTRGVEPTMYGDALVKCGSVVFDELRQGVRHIEFLSDPTTGELRIGCPDVVGAVVIPPVLERFSKKYPHVVLHIDNVLSPAVEDGGLRDRKYDLVLGRSPLLPAENAVARDLNVEFLFDDPFVLVTGAHTRWARRRKIDLAELMHEPWIVQAPPTSSYKFLADAFRARGLEMPKTSIVTVSEPLRTSLLENGSYITVFPSSWFALQSRRHALKVLPVELPTSSWPIAILTLKNRTLSPVAARFIECAREAAKSLVTTAQS